MAPQSDASRITVTPVTVDTDPCGISQCEATPIPTSSFGSTGSVIESLCERQLVRPLPASNSLLLKHDDKPPGCHGPSDNADSSQG